MLGVAFFPDAGCSLPAMVPSEQWLSRLGHSSALKGTSLFENFFHLPHSLSPVWSRHVG
jgi:hypothetical protein